MKRIVFVTFAFLVACGSLSQTVVSRSYKIKNTLIEWSVVGRDTIYTVPVTDWGSPLHETIILSFRGSASLLSTLQWLATADIADGDLVQLDSAVDKNKICRASQGFASGFLVYNRDGLLPLSVFWMKRFVRDDYKRCLKHFSNGKK